MSDQLNETAVASGDQSAERRTGAFVRDAHDIDVRHGFKQFRPEMIRGT